MDIRLFAVKINRPLTEDEVRSFLRIMPDDRRERLMRMPRDELRQEPLCAYALLYLATRTIYGWPRLPEIRYNKYGKPEFSDWPDVQFNISHTRGAALVGIHDEPLGVDIERLRPVSERAMQRIAGTASRQEFFESWVRREARVKRSGGGLGPLRTAERPEIPDERILYLETFPDYAACLCTLSRARTADVLKFVI